ncbi:MAG TPA: alginate lyase family protein [Lacunisphaera sp.]|nr:alginate lyase family protein [Lacunisphaera sp.]
MLFFPDFDLAVYEKPRIEHVASAALDSAPRSLTSVVNPRSAGGPHDFSSEGDYWWPDPKDPAAPHIQRDGLSNPDNFVAHRRLMMDMARDVGALAAAWKVTHEERYAAAAVKHLRVWFVDEATRMNPNLLYAQAIKGRSTGRSIGVIDTLHLAEVALAVEALRGSAALTSETEAALTGWFRDYLQWLRTHPYGVEESKAQNNHGTCWTLQAACFARLTRDEDVLAECRHRLKEVHLPGQMATDGSFPQELRRTKPYGYSIFNLDVMTACAVVLSTPKENLMTWALPDGRSLAKGVAWLAPYLADKGRWLKNVKRFNLTDSGPVPTDEPVKPDVMYWDEWPVRQPCLLFGALATGNRDWLVTWKKLNADPQVEEVRRNFPIREPVLWISPGPDSRK